MSKHSKWSKVKHYKGAADAKRAAIFTRLGRTITVAAREGGGDPNFNFRLRSAIDQALAGNMPKDNIDRAVKKGTGEIASDRIEEVVYEGYGPGGAAVLVEALTDNRNRTSSNMKHAFSSHGGNLGASGSVQWMFERKGIVTLGVSPTESQELELIEAGADDISSEDSEVIISCSPEALGRLRAAAEAAALTVKNAEFTWQAKEMVTLSDEEKRAALQELLEALDEDEDTSAVYTNVTL